VASVPRESIKWDLEKLPWPLEDNACLIILAAHVIEHVKPWTVMAFMDELWRVMKPNGQLALSTPYAGSPTWHHDPTHCTGFTELSFCYFAPAFPALYAIHKPKPWLIDKGSPVWKSEQNIECLLRAIK
jgi:SAM-dependent methyltransferase